MREWLNETWMARAVRLVRWRWLIKRGRPIPLHLMLDVTMDWFIGSVKALHHAGYHDEEADVVMIANSFADQAEAWTRSATSFDDLRGLSASAIDAAETVLVRAMGHPDGHT